MIWTRKDEEAALDAFNILVKLKPDSGLGLKIVDAAINYMFPQMLGVEAILRSSGSTREIFQ